MVLALQLAEQILRAHQMVVEDATGRVEQLGDQRIAHGVSHAHALFAAGHDVVGAQDRQLLRHDGLLDAQRVPQLLDVLLALDEEFEDPDANRMGQGSEEGGLEGLEFLGCDGGHHPHSICAMNAPHGKEAHCDRSEARRHG